MNKLNYLVAVLGILLIACTKQERVPYYDEPTFTPLWIGETDFLVDTVHRIGDFQLIDQSNEQVTQNSVARKIYVANFFFTSCPSICPKMTLHLKKVQDEFQREHDVMILSHSVMPWADSTRRLREFADIHDINYPQWRLLTGTTSDIYMLARRSYFAEELAGFNRDSTEFVHTEHCLLVDREGHLRGIYNGTLELEIDRMITDIRILLDQ